MRKALRRLALGAGILIGLLVLAVLAFALFFDLGRYKPRIEAAVAKSTGMQLELLGKAKLSFLPHVGIALQDVRLANRGSELFQAKELTVAARLAPLLFHREVVIDKVVLDQPNAKIERSAKGRMNFEVEGQAPKRASPGAKPREREAIHSLQVKDGTLSYVDHETGLAIRLEGINATISGFERAASPKGAAEGPMTSLSFNAKIRAETLKLGNVVVSRLGSDIHDDHGLVRLDGTEASAFGGDFRGQARIDLRGRAPKLELTQKGSHIDLAQLPAGERIKPSGLADLALNLSASGKTESSIAKTAKGTVALRSEKVTLSGIDIDDLASKLKTAQGLDLVRLGSALFSGLLGQGARAAGIAGGAKEARSVIHPLVADWEISNGLANAKDVAFFTDKTRIAFKGKINLVNRTYQEFYIATLDNSGCSKLKVKVEGPLGKPRPSAGSIGEQISKSYAGQLGSEAGSIGKSIGGLFSSKDKAGQPAPDSGCDHFYAGAALAG